jgi:hypothetical protein
MMNIRDCDPEVRYLNVKKFRSLVEPFGYKVDTFVYDCGEKVYVKGPGLPFLFNGMSDCGDDWTAAGHAFGQMVELNLIPDAVLDTVFSKE